jgi:hypothetical protein
MNKKSTISTKKKSKPAKKTYAAKKAVAKKKPPTQKSPSITQTRVRIPTVPVYVKLVKGTVSAASAAIRRDQEVHWTCNAGHLEIIFPTAIPFGGPVFRTRKDGGCFSGTPKTTTPKTYSYTVKVYTEEGVKQGTAQLTVK